MQPRVVESGVVGELVDHGLAYLAGQRARVGKVLLERQPKERDLVRQCRPVGAPFDGWNALVQAVQRLVLVQPLFGELFHRRLIVDDDGHVLEQAQDLRGQPVEGRLDELLEAFVARPDRLRQRRTPRRMAACLLATASKGHVHMLLSVAEEQSVAGEPESLVITVDTGERIHFLDWGGGPTSLPPLVLIHGLGSTCWAWTPIARRLRTVTHVVALDLRGHGLSDSPRTGYDLESLAFDALTVMVGNGWGMDVDGPPAVVAGHGLGAMVAAAMAGVQPPSIAGLALIDGGWEALEESTGLSAAEFERSIGDPPEVLASMDAYLADRREYDPASWDADQERAARAAVDEKHAGHVASVVRPFVLHSTIEAMFSYDPIGALASVRAPILVAVAESGTVDDDTVRDRLAALDDVQRARAVAGAAPMTVDRFPGAGHNLMRYRPDELAAALKKLLEASAHQRS